MARGQVDGDVVDRSGRVVARFEPQVKPDDETMLKKINELLEDSTFYDEAAWNGIALNDEAQALVKRHRSEPSTEEVARLNRLLLRGSTGCCCAAGLMNFVSNVVSSSLYLVLILDCGGNEL